MTKRTKRTDRSGDGAPLTDSPFAGLGNLLNREDLPENAVGPSKDDREPGGAAATPWSVARSRKGGYKLRFEKRGGGKVVTLLEGVNGGGDALLKVLKQRCATGGKLDGTTIVLQGDHREKVESVLRDHG